MCRMILSSSSSSTTEQHTNSDSDNIIKSDGQHKLDSNGDDHSTCCDTKPAIRSMIRILKSSQVANVVRDENSSSSNSGNSDAIRAVDNQLIDDEYSSKFYTFTNDKNTLNVVDDNEDDMFSFKCHSKYCRKRRRKKSNSEDILCYEEINDNQTSQRSSSPTLFLTIDQFEPSADYEYKSNNNSPFLLSSSSPSSTSFSSSTSSTFSSTSSTSSTSSNLQCLSTASIINPCSSSSSSLSSASALDSFSSLSSSASFSINRSPGKTVSTINNRSTNNNDEELSSIPSLSSTRCSQSSSISSSKVTRCNQSRTGFRVSKHYKSLLSWLTFISYCNFFLLTPIESCSSRSTPKPRPASPTSRPNVTFQTYACPEAYAKWYCLNGATCFAVRIGESILYNCECAPGYMGQRCEFKDLEGSYTPSRDKVMIATANMAGGVSFAVFFIVILCIAVKLRKDYLASRRRRRDDEIYRIPT
ncbi:uncharacterized protein LOC141854918 [Brevipalpus obovatus]|uniref:uncharacterized protein LOC141854918 n=1 Tax=Brevipalpus obovatus TaxID=246614 RepID=UPI003D9E792E